MLFNMAMRHGGILDPSKFTRSQLSGVLYEHALLEAIINFLNSTLLKFIFSNFPSIFKLQFKRIQ